MIDATTILSAPCATVLDTGEGIPLVVNHREWDPTTDPSGPADRVTLTQDGRSYDPRWHQGAEEDAADVVYVERWSAAGRVFHGWISATSRQLVQAG